MTDIDESFNHTVSSFYDKLAPEYDLMTGFEKRFVHEKPFFRLLVDRYNISTALDAGCGTGFHSLLLAQLGVNVTAVDVSQKMIDALASHARAMKLKIHTVESTFQDLPQAVHATFDAVVCMGNSLAHLLSQADLLRTLNNFFSLITPGGVLFTQNLNYTRILTRNERIQSIKEQDGVTFVRFYDYRENRIFFNILTLTKTNTGIAQDLSTIELRPVLKDELFSLLATAGFKEIKAFGGISMEGYQPDSSRDLVVLATKTTQ